MSEPKWTVTEVPPHPTPHDRQHVCDVDGLTVTVKDRPSAPGGACTWTVQGYLGDIRIYAYSATDAGGYGTSVEQARADAIAAARRLSDVGVRGERGYTVRCCGRLFGTREEAAQHEQGMGVAPLLADESQS